MLAAAMVRSSSPCPRTCSRAMTVISKQAASASASASATTSRHYFDDNKKEHRPRPLVVLAGWLGCQPKSLQRYRQLYQQQQQQQQQQERYGLVLDFDVLLCIAPPSAVVQSVFTTTTRTTTAGQQHALIPPNGWPFHQQEQQQKQKQQQQSLEEHEDVHEHHHHHQHPHVLSAPCMEALAWNVLAHIDQQSTNCSACIFFHVFSNGGCLVWEKVRAILDDNDSSCSNTIISCTCTKDVVPRPPTTTTYTSTEGKKASLQLPSSSVQERLSCIRKRLRGVIFDSCPGTDLYRINEALQYCTWKERINVILQTKSINHLLLDYYNPRRLRELVNQRQVDYRQFLFNDPWQNVRQLYLYAENDPLIDYKSLDALVEHRRQMLGQHVIWKRTWKESRHCAHLLHHPNEYKATIHSFIETCLLDAQQQHQQQQQGDGSSSCSKEIMASKL